jgi:D-ribose pyranose/furanose isomerase RbsD
VTKHDHQKEVEDITSTLSAFAEANTIIVNELNALLKSYKVKVVTLEQEIQQQKDQLENEFKNLIDQKYQLHKVEIDNFKQMHAQ